MPEKTEAQKRAQKAYMAGFARVEIRMTQEHRNTVRAHAEARGESINGFINRAITETMERDDAACVAADGGEKREQDTSKA